MVLPMAGAAIVRPLNAILSNNDPEAYGGALSAVQAASSVRHAVEAVGVLDGLENTEAAEARAVFDALPPALDGAILGALARGLGDGQPVVVDWEPGDALAVRIWEEPGDVATLHIVVVSPDGATYL
jgi:hypothetical protein